MLALITQTKVQRPWMQLVTGTVIHFPLKSNEEPVVEVPQAVTESKPLVEVRKRKSSKIPRMIRTPCRQQTEEEEEQQQQQHKLLDNQQALTDTCHIQAAAVAAAAAAAVTASITGVAVVAPVVRSTRTSRCRIKLAHPEWPPKHRSSSPSPSPSPSPVSRKRETSEPQRVAVASKRKCLIEPLLQLSPSVIEVSDPLKHYGGRKQMLRLLCCDQKQINVPSQLINRYSPVMCERQKEPNFCFSRPIQLDSISSTTLLRLVLWMQQHCHDDLGQLHNALPTLANAKSSMCSWDESFLGFELEPVLQLLLAANCLAINPLMEHTMHYFVELAQQRHNVQRVALQHECQTQTEHQQFDSYDDIHNAVEQQATPQADVQLPQFVAAVEANCDCTVELK